MIGAKGFRSFHWTRGTSSRKVMEAYQGEFFVCVCVWGEKKKRRGGSVREIVFSSYVWRGAHGKCVCRN